MSLQVSATLAARNLDITLDVPEGETLALLGPNGSGKSSLLGILSGLVMVDAGRAELNGRTLFAVGADAERRLWLPPHKRRIALLAQEPLLFPHLSVADNVAFGPASQGRSKAEAREIARHWLDEVDAAELAERKPRQLSGGQAQRVALARALATTPDLLLLDEPLAALDVEMAASMRQTLRRVLAEQTVIIVTHEILDTILLADRIAVLEAGQVVETGLTAAVMRHPRSPFAAGICGLNVLAGSTVDPYALATADGWIIHGEPDVPLLIGERAIAAFRPSAVSVHRDRPTGSARNVFCGAVTALEPLTHLIRVRIGDLSADITPASVAELNLSLGAVVHFAVKAAEVALYPA
ncbi:MAG: ATP-binding cassette domain-containing protein [Actinomycetes bacterium]